MKITIDRSSILYISLILILYIFYRSWDVVAPFAISFIVAYLLSPLVSHIHNKLKLPTWLISLLIVAIVFILFILLWVVLIPLIYDQLAHFVSQIPEYKRYISTNIYPKIYTLAEKFDPNYIEKIQKNLDNIFSVFLHGSTKMINKIWKSGSTVINIIAVIFLVPLVSFYMMKDWQKIYEKTIGIIPGKNRPQMVKLLRDINLALSGFIRGQLNICFILAIYYSIALSIIGLKYGIFIGLTTGLISFIPFVGLTSGFIVSVIVAYFQFASWKSFIAVCIVFLIGNLIESLISPKIVGNKIGLHPVWIIFALFLGTTWFGFVGMLIAIPVAAVINVLIKFLVEIYRNNDILKQGVNNKKK